MILQKNKPIAQGNFSKTPFAHILVYIFNKSLQGTLEVHDGSTEIAIYFSNGCPSKVLSTIPGKRLGEVFEQMGKLTAKQVQESLEAIKHTNELHGQALVRLGLVDGVTLAAGITEQMISRMVSVFALPNAQYAFYQGVNLIQKGPAEMISLNTWALLMAGVREHGRQMNLSPYLDTLEGRAFYVNDAEAVKILRLNKAERLLCRKLIESPQNLTTLKKWDAVESHVVIGVVYVLLITKTLKVISQDEVESEKMHMPKITLESLPPESEREDYSPDIQALRDEIQQRVALISSQNYYQMLGVEPDAASGDIRKSFFKLAKSFHPDRSAKSGLEDLREALAYLFANLSEAQSTLTDAQAKEDYDNSLCNGGGIGSGANQEVESEEDAEVRRIIDADKLYQMAMVLMRQKKNEQAYEMIDEACQSCPTEGDYMAARAYLKMILEKETAENLLSVFREAIRHNPKSERAHFYFGQALKKENRTAEAKQQFQLTVEINPRNIEAAREIRLIEMRSKNTGKNKKPSFFGRLLK